MSEEQPEEERRADIRIVRAADFSYYRVDIKFKDHIFIAIRWDEREEEGRSDVLALARDGVKLMKDAFQEIDIDNFHENLDADWAMEDLLDDDKDDQ